VVLSESTGTTLPLFGGHYLKNNALCEGIV